MGTNTDLVPLSIDHEGSPWPLWRQPAGDQLLIQDLDWAEKLEYPRAYEIRKLIASLGKNGKLGVIFAYEAKNTGRRGRPGKAYYLTEEQAWLVATQSQTPRAWQVTRTMVQVFMLARRGELPGQTSPNLDATIALHESIARHQKETAVVLAGLVQQVTALQNRQQEQSLQFATLEQKHDTLHDIVWSTDPAGQSAPQSQGTARMPPVNPASSPAAPQAGPNLLSGKVLAVLDPHPPGLLLAPLAQLLGFPRSQVHQLLLSMGEAVKVSVQGTRVFYRHPKYAAPPGTKDPSFWDSEVARLTQQNDRPPSLLAALQQFMADRSVWTGTATALLQLLSPPGRPPRDWPKDAIRLGGQLRRIGPALRQAGIELQAGLRAGGLERTRLIGLRKAPSDRQAGAAEDPADEEEPAPAMLLPAPPPPAPAGLLLAPPPPALDMVALRALVSEEIRSGLQAERSLLLPAPQQHERARPTPAPSLAVVRMLVSQEVQAGVKAALSTMQPAPVAAPAAAAEDGRDDAYWDEEARKLLDEALTKADALDKDPGRKKRRSPLLVPPSASRTSAAASPAAGAGEVTRLREKAALDKARRAAKPPPPITPQRLPLPGGYALLVPPLSDEALDQLAGVIAKGLVKKAMASLDMAPTEPEDEKK